MFKRLRKKRMWSGQAAKRIINSAVNQTIHIVSMMKNGSLVLSLSSTSLTPAVGAIDPGNKLVKYDQFFFLVRYVTSEKTPACVSGNVESVFNQLHICGFRFVCETFQDFVKDIRRVRVILFNSRSPMPYLIN